MKSGEDLVRNNSPMKCGDCTSSGYLKEIGLLSGWPGFAMEVTAFGIIHCPESCRSTKTRSLRARVLLPRFRFSEMVCVTVGVRRIHTRVPGAAYALLQLDDFPGFAFLCGFMLSFASFFFFPLIKTTAF